MSKSCYVFFHLNRIFQFQAIIPSNGGRVAETDKILFVAVLFNWNVSVL